jgi:two-component system, cell cycle sensor histidine kinase and response regulator CckA
MDQQSAKARMQPPATKQGTVSEQTRLFEQARLQLARLGAADGAPLPEVWSQLATIVTHALDVERAGVWVLVDEGRALRCRYLFQRSSCEVFHGAVLRAQHFPGYFKAIHSRRTLPAGNAQQSELTSELREPYLEPLGITSTLDAPIYVGGQVVGVVCHEHVGWPREWTGAESDFASAVADNIARLYQEHESQHAQTALHVYERHLMELHRMEAVGRMAAGIAHDFRGILAAASGYAELIRRTPGLPQDADRYAQKIGEILQRGSQLTHEVMNFGKDTPVSPRVIEVGSTLDSLSSMFRVLLHGGIRINWNVKHPVSRIFMDASQLERVVLNLVLNARDAMPSGGDLTIHVEDVSVEDDDGDCGTFVGIQVRDTGIGMDEATQANLFKPFFSTKGEHGTGLGLVIVDQIVSRAGGFIRVESAPDKGTTVKLYIPRIATAID